MLIGKVNINEKFFTEHKFLLLRAYLVCMLLLTSFYSFRYYEIQEYVFLKISVSFNIFISFLLFLSFSKFLITTYSNQISKIIHGSLILYLAFLIFYNINYVFVLILVVFILSYYFRYFSQLIFFGVLLALLLTVIYVYGNISTVNKINLIIFVLAYTITAFIYLNKNIKINQKFSFNDNLLQSIYNEISDGLLVVDLNKNIIVKHNSKLAVFFNIITGKKISNRTGFNIFSDVLEEYKLHSGTNNNAWKTEYVFDTFTGKQFWGEITIKPINIDKKKYFVINIIDITQKKLKEETINKLSFALSTNPGIILIFNNQGTIEYINEKFTKLTGFSPHEILGTKVTQHGYKTNESIFKILIKLKTNAKWEGEIQSFNKKGELISVKATITVVSSDNNIAPRYTFIGEDITKQKIAEKAFMVAEHKYQTIMQTIPDLMFVINKNGVFSDYKSENEEELYVPSEKIIGGNIKDIGLPESIVNTTLSNLDKILKGEAKSKIFEYSLNIAGEDRFYECRMIALNPDEVLSIIRNITERVVAENKLKNSEENYKNLVENSPNAIILHKGKNVFYANKTALEILGYQDFDQMKNVSLNDLILDGEMEHVNQRWNDAKNKIDVPYMEFTIKSPFDGRLIDIESKPSLIEYNNEEVFQIVFREISIQKRLEQEKLRASIAEDMNINLLKEIKERILAQEELKKSNLEKEVLLKEVHHRVKNNMQVISSILNLQAHTIRNKKVKTLFEESQDRIKSMALIHENLYKTKDLAHIDFEVYVRNLMNSIWKSHNIDEERITYQLDLEKILVTVDIGIPCGLIINELVSNALKHAFNESDKGCIFLSLHKSLKEVSLIIKDNGKGLNKDYDLGSAPSLGLQLVHTLIQQIDGKISIENTSGTKFIINFIV